MTLLVALACARAALVGAEPPAPPTAEPPAELPEAEQPMSHPGTIAFVDLPTGETKHRPVAEVPDAIAWYGTGAERVPVVRIEASDRGGALEIKRYGPDGALLDVTMSQPPR